MFQKTYFPLLLIGLLGVSQSLWAQYQDLELSDVEDVNMLMEDSAGATTSDETGTLNLNGDEGTVSISKQEELDDLGALREDLGEEFFSQEEKEAVEHKDNISDLLEQVKAEEGSITFKDQPAIKVDVANPSKDSLVLDDLGDKKVELFDVGAEEKEILKISKFIEKKMPADEWHEIADSSKLDKYIVQDGDWLWKICKELFGSGFYYAKVWSLNPYIKNPHEIEPGMVLEINTGDELSTPEIKVGSFDNTAEQPTDAPKIESKGAQEMALMADEFSQWGDEAQPPWLLEKKNLLEQGIYVEFASPYTYDDLKKASETSLVREYERYEPEQKQLDSLQLNQDKYDEVGFDRNAKISYDFKEGFDLHTFVTRNPIQDLGKIHSVIEEGMTSSIDDKVYVEFNSHLKIEPDDLFSVYAAEGTVEHETSDRSGYRFSIIGHLKVIRKVKDLWECIVTRSTGVIQRKDRITVYTPKIDRIVQTFNTQNIEASIIGAYNNQSQLLSYGSVLYLDRGRADGVEMGNVFEIYDFKDRGTERKITNIPTYKIGEVTVITLTENFATGLVTMSTMDAKPGQIVISKTMDDVAREAKVKGNKWLEDSKRLSQKALEELDVELSLDDMNDALLDKADKIKLSEDELAELERQEREKDMLREHERDLRSLEKLESEIEDAEKILQEAKVDEDKLMELENLNKVENDETGKIDDMNLAEDEFGKLYLDEDLNNKENPYGLTEFDVEELDELMKADMDYSGASNETIDTTDK